MKNIISVITLFFIFITPIYAKDDILAKDQKRFTQDEANNISIFENNVKSIVHVSNIVTRKYLFSNDSIEIPHGSGSGFVWDKKGHIITNYHVIKGGNRFQISFDNDKRK